jgi:hypothetical protein
VKRGVLEITRSELDALVKRFDLSKFAGTSVESKVSAALSADASLPVKLELSEEELEVLMDEVTFPMPEDSLETVSLRKKMIDMMARFRSVI